MFDNTRTLKDQVVSPDKARLYRSVADPDIRLESTSCGGSTDIRLWRGAI